MSVHGESISDYCRGAFTMLTVAYGNGLLTDESAKVLAEGFVSTLYAAVAAHAVPVDRLEMTEAVTVFDPFLLKERAR